MKKLPLTVLASLLCALPLASYAQTINNTPVKKQETEAETIKRCLNDAKSKSDEVRKRAILILGKYSHPSATLAVIKHLNDPSSKVRTASLVSLYEKSYVPQEAVFPIFERLADENVHIRRLASASLNKISSFLLMKKKQKLPQSVSSAIAKAFNDKEDSVRMNMVKMYDIVFDKVSPTFLKDALKDPNDDVRISALQQVLRNRKLTILTDQATALSKDDNAVVRMNLAKGLSSLGMRDSKLIDILYTLSKDSSPVTSAYAFSALARMGQPVDVKAISERLAVPGLDIEVGRQLISSLPVTEETKDLLSSLIKHERPEYREAVLMKAQMVKKDIFTEEQLFEALNDPFKSVRRTAGYVIGRRSKNLAKHLQDLTFNEYQDVRELVISLSGRLPKEQAKPLIMDLLLDDQAAVRSRAVTSIARRRFEGWEDILIQALDDDSRIVQDKAVRSLLRVLTPTTTTALKAYAKRSPHSPVSRQITMQLQKAAQKRSKQK